MSVWVDSLYLPHGREDVECLKDIPDLLPVALLALFLLEVLLLLECSLRMFQLRGESPIEEHDHMVVRCDVPDRQLEIDSLIWHPIELAPTLEPLLIITRLPFVNFLGLRHHMMHLLDAACVSRAFNAYLLKLRIDQLDGFILCFFLLILG